jgi:hypothetical protein
MRFNEIVSDMQTFVATVRVICGATSVVVKTAVDAESQTHARALLCHIYGASNVLSVVRQSVNEDGAKILSPDEQRVKAMSDQAKRLQQQAKQIKAQSAVKKAQAQVNKALKQSKGLPS